jgi:SAM-dependent methyltransferase
VKSVPKFLTERRGDVRDTAPWSPFAYVNRRLRELVRILIENAALAPGSKVLDYGCADAPYRSELPPGVEYFGADLVGNPWAQVELREDGTVPMADACCDLVLSTQVLEHVEDPQAYLSESFRLLRPGGSLALSTHGIMYYHPDPTDHWRWTASGLTKAVEAAGFSVAEIRGIVGLTSAALQLFQDGTYSFVPRVLKPVYALIMQGLIALADRFYSDEARIANALVIAVRAVKPSQ